MFETGLGGDGDETGTGESSVRIPDLRDKIHALVYLGAGRL